MIGELSAELLTTHYVASIETAISIFYNWLKTKCRQCDCLFITLLLLIITIITIIAIIIITLNTWKIPKVHKNYNYYFV